MILKMFHAIKIINIWILILCNSIEINSKIFILGSELTYNPTYMDDHRIVIHENKLGLDAFFILVQDFPLDPWIKVTFNLKNRKTNRYREIFATDNNICQILGRGEKSFMTTWVNNILKYGNLPSSCPLRKGKYSFYNLSAESVNVPKFMAGLYRAQVETYFRKKTVKVQVANLTLNAQLK